MPPPVCTFVEVHVATPLDVCEQRDPKGLYARARRGEVSRFTGISAPYEVPESPELALLTPGKSPEESAREVLANARVGGSPLRRRRLRRRVKARGRTTRAGTEAPAPALATRSEVIRPEPI